MTAYTTDWAKDRQEIWHTMDLHCSMVSGIVDSEKASVGHHKIRLHYFRLFSNSREATRLGL